VYGIPCALELITGFLNANDSNGTNGDSSQFDGRMRNSLCEYADITSSRGGFLPLLFFRSILIS